LNSTHNMCCSRTRHRWTAGPPVVFPLCTRSYRGSPPFVALTLKCSSRRGLGAAPHLPVAYLRSRPSPCAQPNTPASTITAALVEPPLHSLPEPPDHSDTFPSTHSTTLIRVSSRPRRPFAGAHAPAATAAGRRQAPSPAVGVLDRQPTKGSTRSRRMWPHRDW
jgi:hypothetical protein